MAAARRGHAGVTLRIRPHLWIRWTASVLGTAREVGPSWRGGCGQGVGSVSLLAIRPLPFFLCGQSAAGTALQRSDRGQAAAASAGRQPGHVLPSFRLPMTACFFRKSAHSFLLRPKARMLWVKVLAAHGRDVKAGKPGNTPTTRKQHARHTPVCTYIHQHIHQCINDPSITTSIIHNPSIPSAPPFLTPAVRRQCSRPSCNCRLSPPGSCDTTSL